MNYLHKKTIILTLFLFIFTFPEAKAAPLPGDRENTAIDERERLDAAKRREAEQREQIDAPHITLQDKKRKHEPIELPKEEISFRIKKIIVECSEPGRFPWAQKLLEPYENRRIGIEGINLLVNLLSENIIDRGYVTTKVTLPEQDLTSGILRLIIMPGKISKIRFADDQTWGTWKNAFPTHGGKILNIRSLEQGLEQMKRVPNQDVKMDLVPGENPGESEVVITVVREKPWTIGISFDDSNLKSTGRYQASGSLSFYNITGANDVISYTYGHDTEGKSSQYGSKNYNFSYSIPYGNYTFSVLKYKSDYYQTVPVLLPFKSSSNTETLEFNLQRLLYRDQTRKTQLALKLLLKDRHSYVDGVELEVQRQKTTAYQIGILHRQYWGQNIIDMMVYYQKGVPCFGAKPGYSDEQPDFGTTRYALWGMNLNLAVPMKLNKADAKYTFTFRGQYTKDALYSSDQFSIGGRYTVRGFSGENTLAAENGFVIRNEISIPLKKIGMETFVGLDVGHVWGPYAKYLHGKNLAVIVFGIRGSLFKHLQYEGFIGAPLHKPEGFKADKTVLGFQLYLSF